MADWETGKGKFGVKVTYKDGDVERAWSTTRSERDKVYKQMSSLDNVKTVDKIKR